MAKEIYSSPSCEVFCVKGLHLLVSVSLYSNVESDYGTLEDNGEMQEG